MKKNLCGGQTIDRSIFLLGVILLIAVNFDTVNIECLSNVGKILAEFKTGEYRTK